MPAETPVAAVDVAPPVPGAGAPAGVSRAAFLATSVVAGLSLVAALLLWQKLANIQEQLARQSQDAGSNAVEARTLARQAQDLARDTAARQAVLDTRLGEVALQRAQVEELVQSMSRSRDENLLADIESGLRLAQQQAQLTGSAEPLLASLRTADQRLERAGQPRLSRVRAAVQRDIDRIKGASVADVPGLLARIDELARQVDELPLANAVSAAHAQPLPRNAATPARRWWDKALADIADQARALVRVSRIDTPEAALVAPDQAFFLRENLKLKLLNARLSLLSRQVESARSDAAAAGVALQKYFDPASRRTQAALALAQQVQAQLKSVEIPRVDETLAALTTAQAGR